MPFSIDMLPQIAPPFIFHVATRTWKLASMQAGDASVGGEGGGGGRGLRKRRRRRRPEVPDFVPPLSSAPVHALATACDQMEFLPCSLPSSLSSSSPGSSTSAYSTPSELFSIPTKKTKTHAATNRLDEMFDLVGWIVDLFAHSSYTTMGVHNLDMLQFREDALARVMHRSDLSLAEKVDCIAFFPPVFRDLLAAVAGKNATPARPAIHVVAGGVSRLAKRLSCTIGVLVTTHQINANVSLVSFNGEQEALVFGNQPHPCLGDKSKQLESYFKDFSCKSLSELRDWTQPGQPTPSNEFDFGASSKAEEDQGEK